MPTFDEIYESFGQVLLDEVGQSATFIPKAGPPVTCLVFLDKEDESMPGGMESAGVSKVLTIRYLLNAVGKLVERGERFRIGTTEYKVQANAELADKDNVIKAFVK